MSEQEKPRVLSGIQPSGSMHLGNYLGAIRNWVDDQDKYNNYFMIADYHSLNTIRNGTEMRRNRKELVAMLLACGIDPERSVLFYQSELPEHTELAWIFTSLSPLGWLERMTQYKDKMSRLTETASISTGLLTYPALQAADILLYQADLVPVGADQRQHIEFTRDLAARFNNIFGETFVLPKAEIRKEVANVPSLTNPAKKMSKSNPDGNGRIDLLDQPNVIKKKFKRATTDSFRDVVFSDDPERAGLLNILSIYKAMTGKDEATIEAEFVGKGYGDLKVAVGEATVAHLEPIQAEYKRIMADKGYIKEVMDDGADRARRIARKTLRKVRRKIGME